MERKKEFMYIYIYTHTPHTHIHIYIYTHSRLLDASHLWEGCEFCQPSWKPAPPWAQHPSLFSSSLTGACCTPGPRWSSQEGAPGNTPRTPSPQGPGHRNSSPHQSRRRGESKRVAFPCALLLKVSPGIPHMVEADGRVCPRHIVLPLPWSRGP